MWNIETDEDVPLLKAPQVGDCAAEFRGDLTGQPVVRKVVPGRRCCLSFAGEFVAKA